MFHKSICLFLCLYMKCSNEPERLKQSINLQLETWCPMSLQHCERSFPRHWSVLRPHHVVTAPAQFPTHNTQRHLIPLSLSWKQWARHNLATWSIKHDQINNHIFAESWQNIIIYTFLSCHKEVTSEAVISATAVLCTSEDCVILQSIWNTSIAPTWQFTL